MLRWDFWTLKTIRIVWNWKLYNVFRKTTLCNHFTNFSQQVVLLSLQQLFYMPTSGLLHWLFPSRRMLFPQIRCPFGSLCHFLQVSPPNVTSSTRPTLCKIIKPSPIPPVSCYPIDNICLLTWCALYVCLPLSLDHKLLKSKIPALFISSSDEFRSSAN